MKETFAKQEANPLATIDTNGDLTSVDSIDLFVPKRDEIHSGTIVQISDDQILIDIGYKSEGTVPQHELSKLSDSVMQKMKVGDQVMTYVLRGADQDKPMILSLLKAQELQEWEQAKQQMIAKSIHNGHVLEINKGGVIVEVGNLRGFLPSSCINLEHNINNKNTNSQNNWNHLLGQKITYKIIEVSQKRNKLIVSERAAQKEVQKSKREHLLSTIQISQVLSGTVVSLEKFGAFVDIGGIDGLVHNSEISWKRVSHPSEVLRVGQTVNVVILTLDLERSRIGLSLKALQQNPWDNIQDILIEGQLAYATVTNVTKFGIFASLKDCPTIEGFVHITELSDDIVKDPKEVVTIGEEVIVRIMSIDKTRQRLRLSIKEVVEDRFEDSDYFLYLEKSLSN
ncbi:MAG TPA: 30S ribosomal protein S1 [Chloroflexi bacterium]|nr:30S ribosomal protein S1 [Chloroflexota bacterium]|tara:strand:- start:4227 stop:5417 length:1191 start_codon:yes stop_codon:yes gene_type:complete